MKMKNPSLDALVIFPPPYIPTELQPGIAAVAAYAKYKELKIQIIDANIGGLEFVLKKIDLANSKESLAVLTNPLAYTPDKFEQFRKAKQTIETISKKASERFLLRRNTVQYIPQYDTQSRVGILKALENPSDNLFFDYFDQELIPELRKIMGYKVVGIGITDRKQAIPGFLLGNMIKQAIPGVRVVIGGNYISKARETFLQNDNMNKRLFDYFDYLIYLEADKSFADLVSVIGEGREFESRINIEKLIWKEQDKIHSTPLKTITDISTLPLPIFDGLRAWTPEPAISYNFQRGCNYGKCGFCGLMDGYDSYAMRSEEEPDVFIAKNKGIGAVIEEIKEFIESGYKYINFVDETFFAADMERFAKKVIEEDLDIKWTCYARVEDKFTDSEFCKLLAQAGCDFIQFGVESASVKSLELMTKGVDNLNVHNILQNTHNAGIMNHVFVMVGYPGETIQDALTLFHFLDQSKDYTFTIKPTWFKLAKGSPDSYKLDIRELKRTYTEGDLAPNLHFEKKKGMSKKATQAMNELLNSWVRRYHTLNYVAGTYCYSQRFFIGYDGILEITEKINQEEITKDPNFKPDTPYTKAEKKALGVLWKALVGEEYFTALQKYKAGNRNSNFLQSYEHLKQNNKIAIHFPDGFSTIEDVVKLAYILIS
ncbi:MAG: radical SAM protein [Candidatus Woesearchaeota archaeon]